MYRVVLAAASCLALAGGAATAQEAGPSASASSSMSATPNDFSDSLDRQGNFRRLDGDVAGSSRSLRQFSVRPKDVVQGLTVHDADGLVVGTIAKVDSGVAVVASTLGSVEVDVASFAKNKNGLLINLPKTKIDGMMARSPKPAG